MRRDANPYAAPDNADERKVLRRVVLVCCFAVAVIGALEIIVPLHCIAELYPDTLALAGPGPHPPGIEARGVRMSYWHFLLAGIRILFLPAIILCVVCLAYGRRPESASLLPVVNVLALRRHLHGLDKAMADLFFFPWIATWLGLIIPIVLWLTSSNRIDGLTLTIWSIAYFANAILSLALLLRVAERASSTEGSW